MTGPKTDLQTGVPHNAECGDVYEIQDREAAVKFTRKLAGSIAKTTEPADSRQCETGAKYQVELVDGLYLGVCDHHKTILTT